MPPEMNGFLKAEESANQLISSVERLNEEIDGYSGARTTLEEAGGRLIPLVDALTSTAAKTTEVMHALSQIGTAEILDEVKAVSSGNESMITAITTGSETQTVAIDSLKETVSQQSEVAQNLFKEIRRLHDQGSTFQEELTHINKKVNGLFVLQVITFLVLVVFGRS